MRKFGKNRGFIVKKHGKQNTADTCSKSISNPVENRINLMLLIDLAINFISIGGS